MTTATAVWLGAAALAIGLMLLSWIALAPSNAVPLHRRRLGAPETASFSGRATTTVTAAVSRSVLSGGRDRRLANVLDRAGVRREPAEFVVLVVGFAVAAFGPGYLLAGPWVGLALTVLAVVVIVAAVYVRSERRKRAFGDDLDDILALLASNVRAGHSLLQALDTVARELDDPAKTEIARAVNQVRLGRDLAEAVGETADRMDSDDFRWVAQAIAIHRQVGGNLGHILDTIGVTIRDRGRIKRQVRALSAEGRLSAWVLVALPFAVGLAMIFLNPTYLVVLTQEPLGILMIAGAVVLMAAGAVWLRKTVEVRF
ncbi:type II secretion system F family protein [Actinosynnema sp.]|uniref:type II secretion system F family protein n=1 Tax=Actinosynnema sp. TaxID=1872144 RepID=UPI003F86C9A6